MVALQLSNLDLMRVCRAFLSSFYFFACAQECELGTLQVRCLRIVRCSGGLALCRPVQTWLVHQMQNAYRCAAGRPAAVCHCPPLITAKPGSLYTAPDLDIGMSMLTITCFFATTTEQITVLALRLGRQARRQGGCTAVRAARGASEQAEQTGSSTDEPEGRKQPDAGAGTLASSAAGLLLWAAFVGALSVHALATCKLTFGVEGNVFQPACPFAQAMLCF